jgi:Ca2+-binding RTX toxin-like protein
MHGAAKTGGNPLANTFDNLITGTVGRESLSDSLIPAGETVLISGLGGNDTLFSFGPLTRIDGGSGKDFITSLGGTVFGGNGDDEIHVTGTGGKIHGGHGDDLIVIEEAGLAPGAIFTIVCETTARARNETPGDDTVIGCNAYERVFDGCGSDTVDLGVGGIINAGLGGSDTYIGSTTSTAETVAYRNGGNVIVSLGDESASGAGIGSDILIGIDRIITGSGDDWVYGNAAAYNEIITGSGDDNVSSQAAHGVIRTGAGIDWIFTKDGDFEIDAGTGMNVVVCGNGQETISFMTSSVGHRQEMIISVSNFEAGVDKIRLDAGTDIVAFLATGHESNTDGNDGMRFDIAANKFIHLVGLTTGQLSIDDFIA